MTSSMMYGVPALCDGVEEGCADRLIKYKTKDYWRRVVGDGIYYVIFQDAYKAAFRTGISHLYITDIVFL